ncbi:MAG: LacI family DNA-binding transcriptional regulator [Burkholderiales bacterium]|nr:LacI family DNA-binding transcriptional regulator [Phycisphaerae bacterium]
MSIVEVARLAGVSSSTVSRVINNHPRVAKDTVRAVRGAMDKLKYTPSDRRPGPKPGMRGGLSGATIGFLVFGTGRDRTTPAFEELMRGVSAGASRYNLKLVYHHVLDSGNLPSQVIDGPFEGLLLHGSLPSAGTKERLRRFPTVWLMGNRRRPDWGDQVMPDAYEIGDKAARYLLGCGHKKLAFLNLDLGHWPFRVASQSFIARAQEEDAHVDLVERARSDDERTYWPQFAGSAADEVVKRYLKLDPRPTGIFAADDMQVALIQPALQRAGVEIGRGNVEIISCNNERPYLIGLAPRPAEIDIRVESIGMRGVERLIWRLNNRALPERIVTAIEPIVISHDGKTMDWADSDEN